MRLNGSLRADFFCSVTPQSSEGEINLSNIENKVTDHEHGRIEGYRSRVRVERGGEKKANLSILQEQ